MDADICGRDFEIVARLWRDWRVSYDAGGAVCHRQLVKSNEARPVDHSSAAAVHHATTTRPISRPVSLSLANNKQQQLPWLQDNMLRCNTQTHGSIWM